MTLMKFGLPGEDRNLEVCYDPNNNLADNFTYLYYTVIGNPSNRLKSIGSGSDYTYDPSGNVSFDDLNKNLEFVYDWRNLMIENKNVSSLFTFRLTTNMMKLATRSIMLVKKHWGNFPHPQ